MSSIFSATGGLLLVKADTAVFFIEWLGLSIKLFLLYIYFPDVNYLIRLETVVMID